MAIMESSQGEVGIVEERLSTSEVRRYELGRPLERNHSGRIYEVVDCSTRATLAMRVTPKTQLTKQRALAMLNREIEIHQSLQHPAIVRFHHHFEDAENVYLLFEALSGNTLKSMLEARKRFPESELKTYLRPVVAALQYLHSRQILHRNLILSAVCITAAQQVKVSDFAFAAEIAENGGRRYTICGTPNYISPEVLFGNGYSYEVDVWALGVMIYALLVGRPPFETPDVKATYRLIRTGVVQFPDRVALAESSKDLIRGLLTVDPLHRSSLHDVLRHPLFSDSDLPSSIQLMTRDHVVEER